MVTRVLTSCDSLQSVTTYILGSCAQFLDGFYLSRIGIRILIGQHIALHEDKKPDHIGAECRCLSAMHPLSSSCCMLWPRCLDAAMPVMFLHRPHMHRLPATPGGQRCNRRCTGNMFAGVRGCSGRQCVRRPRFCIRLRAITSTSHGEWSVITGGLPVLYGLWCSACRAQQLAVQFMLHI